MKTSTRLYGWLKLLTALHVVEQLIFGMEDLHQLQHMIVVYERWFGNIDTAIAMLVTGGIALAVFSLCVAFSKVGSRASSRCSFLDFQRLVSHITFSRPRWLGTIPQEL